jgi:hypothetical protein
MACALFSLYGYTMFSSVKAMSLCKYHDLKAMVSFGFTKDMYSTGEYYQFLKNPTAEDWKADPVLKGDITRLEAEIYEACKKRATLIGKRSKDLAILDKEIDQAMVEMRLKTIEFLR